MRVLGSARRIAAGLAVTALVVAGPFGVTAARASGTSTISGTVWNDANRNGVFDAGETPFSNEGLVLSDSTGAAIASTSTDANGHYQFTGLTDGTYQVSFDYNSWTALRHNWVPTTTGSIYFKQTVGVVGSATANFGLRSIVRSTSAPISSVTTSRGTVINSYDDAVSAQTLAGTLAAGSLFGAEGPLTTTYFDCSWDTANQTAVQVGGSQGNYSGYQASVYVAYDSWVDNYDLDLFYEYGHAWSLYYAYIVQQDSTLTSYLKARGLYGNPQLGSSLSWEPVELIADDYRQLFGSATAAAIPQDNSQIPPASQVAGLKTFLSTTFMQSPAPPAPPAPPATPTGLTAAAGNSQVALGWHAASAATSYSVLRCAGSGCTPSTAIASTASTSYTDSAVTNYATYVYAVKAVNPAGSSGASPAATATPWTAVTIGSLTVSPQPVSTSATVGFSLSTGATVTAKVLNPSGKLVATLLLNTPEPGGTVAVTWSVPKKASAGTYTVSVSATDPGGHTAAASLSFSVT